MDHGKSHNSRGIRVPHKVGRWRSQARRQPQPTLRRLRGRENVSGTLFSLRHHPWPGGETAAAGQPCPSRCRSPDRGGVGGSACRQGRKAVYCCKLPLRWLRLLRGGAGESTRNLEESDLLERVRDKDSSSLLHIQGTATDAPQLSVD